MAGVTNDLIYETLKQVQSDMSDLKSDVHELKKRMTGVEAALAGVNRWLDRKDDRLEHIEEVLGRSKWAKRLAKQ